MEESKGTLTKPLIENYTEVWGCSAGENCDPKFTDDIINLYRTNADTKANYDDIPKVYSLVKGIDCNLEIVTSNLAQQLRLHRTNDVIGPKVLFYAYDSTRAE